MAVDPSKHQPLAAAAGKIFADQLGRFRKRTQQLG
jgi:hypothetical protein